MTHDQRGSLHPLNDICHRKGFSRPSDSEKRLMPVSDLNGFDQLVNRLLLIPFGRVFAGKFEIHGMIGYLGDRTLECAQK